jgi:hypothetical protein
MFSAVLNAQNKINIPITSVTWSISGNTTSPYTGLQQTVNVVSVNPSNATYILNQTGATNVGSVAQSTLQGTNAYSGTITSPTLTIAPAQLTVSIPGNFETLGARTQPITTTLGGGTPPYILVNWTITNSPIGSSGFLSNTSVNGATASIPSTSGASNSYVTVTIKDSAATPQQVTSNTCSILWGGG